MSILVFDTLDENEFNQLLFALPKDVLSTPFDRSPKKYPEYTAGFRPGHYPQSRIIAAYNKLAYKKIDLKLAEYLEENFINYRRYIDELLNSELLERFKTDNYCKEDLIETLGIFDKNNVKISLELYLKIHEICLSEDLLTFIQEESEKIQKTKELTREIENALKTKYDEILKTKDTEVAILVKRAEDRIEGKYKKLIAEEHEKLQKIIDGISKEKEEIEGINTKYKLEIENLEAVVEELRKKVREQEKLNKNIKGDLFNKENYIIEKESQIGELKNELIKLQRIKISDLIDKKTVDDIVYGISSLEGKERLKDYYEAYSMSTEDYNVRDVWEKWILSERQMIKDFLDIVLSEGKLSYNIIENLDDMVHSLNLRCVLVKLLESISYKYLSMQKYDEAFK